MKLTREQKAQAWDEAASLVEQDCASDDDGEGNDVADDIAILRRHMENVVAPFLRKKAETLRNSPRGATRNKR